MLDVLVAIVLLVVFVGVARTANYYQTRGHIDDRIKELFQRK